MHYNLRTRADGRVAKTYTLTAPRKLRERVGSRVVTDLSANTFGMQMQNGILEGARPAKKSSKSQPIKLTSELQKLRGTGFFDLAQELQDKIYGLMKQTKQMQNRQETRFFDLAQELQDKIYGYVFESQILICNWNSARKLPYISEIDYTDEDAPRAFGYTEMTDYDHHVDSVIMDDCDERDEHSYEYLDMDLEVDQAPAAQWEEEDREKEEEKFLTGFPGAGLLLANRFVSKKAHKIMHEQCTFRFNSNQLIRLMHDTNVGHLKWVRAGIQFRCVKPTFHHIRHIEVENWKNTKHLNIIQTVNLLRDHNVRAITIGVNISQRFFAEKAELSFDDKDLYKDPEEIGDEDQEVGEEGDQDESDDDGTTTFMDDEGVLTRFWDVDNVLRRLTVPQLPMLSFYNFSKEPHWE